MELYVKPNTDLEDSWERTARNLENLITRLSKIHPDVVTGEIINDCFALKSKVIRNLHWEGWKVSNEQGTIKITPPKRGKQND